MPQEQDQTIEHRTNETAPELSASERMVLVYMDHIQRNIREARTLGGGTKAAILIVDLGSPDLREWLYSILPPSMRSSEALRVECGHDHPSLVCQTTIETLAKIASCFGLSDLVENLKQPLADKWFVVMSLASAADGTTNFWCAPVRIHDRCEDCR